MQPGTTLGAYEILSKLGEGGMGEVYRARDTRLDRDVALKILPEAVARDPDRTARFAREARTLAALNHPHIAQLHGFEEAGEIRALVMELVEGEDLSLLIARGPLPLEDALPIARQIAEALESAHDAGIIHRDLKPANIKVRPDGTVKVLDFGLAKALEPATGAAGDQLLSPTITSPAQMTHAGMILGTAAYMSPEQARGRVVDRRTDVWAFGCVLFEMLTGVRAFAGEDVTETLASIMKSDPPMARLPVDTPIEIRRLLTRCLQKDRRQRLQHIGDARLDLDDAAHPQAMTAALPPRGASRQRVLWAGLVLVAGIGGLIVGARWIAAAPQEQPEVRLDLVTPTAEDPASFALSPDGKTMAFVGATPAGQQLQIKRLDGSPSVVLSGTMGARQPFWSPDGRSIAFFTPNKLLRIDVDGGPARPIANVLTPAGGTWNRSGTILFVPNSAGSVFTIPADGGEAVPNATVDPQQRGHRFPHFLPDGRHFLVHAGGGDAYGLYVGELGSPRMRRIANADSAATYASGHLFFAQERTLFAQGFDLDTLTVTGDRKTVVENVIRGSAGGRASIALTGSAHGLVAYRTDVTQAPSRRLLWFDRRGNQLGQVGAEHPRATNPALSLDGRYLAVQESGTSGGGSDIWTIDLVRNVDTKITFDPAIDALPTWSPDGRRLLFNTTRDSPAAGGYSNLYVKDLTSAASEAPLLISAGSKFACDWSRDGRFVLYRNVDPTTGTYDLMAFAADGSSAPFAVASTQYDERDGQFSPDGSTIAFHSDESGRPEIYVQSFPQAGTKTRISTAGGTQPRWRADGNELFYVAPDRMLTAIAITRQADGTLLYGAPAPLFDTHILAVSGVLRQQYVVSPDGQRFLVNATADESTTQPITVVLNWRGVPQQ